MTKNGLWYPDDLHTYKYELKEESGKVKEVTEMEIALEVYKNTSNLQLRSTIETYFDAHYQAVIDDKYGRRKE